MYMASMPPPTPAKNERDDKGEALVVRKVDAHGLGGDLVVADGLEGAAVGGVDQSAQTHADEHADAGCRYGPVALAEVGIALEKVRGRW